MRLRSRSAVRGRLPDCMAGGPVVLQGRGILDFDSCSGSEAFTGDAGARQGVPLSRFRLLSGSLTRQNLESRTAAAPSSQPHRFQVRPNREPSRKTGSAASNLPAGPRRNPRGRGRGPSRQGVSKDDSDRGRGRRADPRTEWSACLKPLANRGRGFRAQRLGRPRRLGRPICRLDGLPERPLPTVPRCRGEFINGPRSRRPRPIRTVPDDCRRGRCR